MEERQISIWKERWNGMVALVWYVWLSSLYLSDFSWPEAWHDIPFHITEKFYLFTAYLTGFTVIINLPEIFDRLAAEVEAMSEQEKKRQHIQFITVVVVGIPLCIVLYVYTKLNS